MKKLFSLLFCFALMFSFGFAFWPILPAQDFLVISEDLNLDDINGFANPAVEDLNMNGFDITGAGEVEGYVPYVGATGDVQLGANNLFLNSIESIGNAVLNVITGTSLAINTDDLVVNPLGFGGVGVGTNSLFGEQFIVEYPSEFNANIDASDQNITADCITLKDGQVFCEKPSGTDTHISGAELDANMNNWFNSYFDLNAEAYINSLDLNNSLDYLKSADVNGQDVNVHNLWVQGSADLNGGGKSLFNFLDGNFLGNVRVDGNLVLNGVMKRDSCPSGYVLVPGNSDFGTSDFCVMKYEAQDCNATCVANGQGAMRQAVSIQGYAPWTDVSWYDAREACRRSGGHLITNAEWMTIARNIEAQASNWQSGVVGSGCLYGGHMDNLPASKLATSDDGTPYYGTLDSSSDAVKCPFEVNVAGAKASKRTMVLSNGEVIWDVSGNVWEWVDEQCANASGYSSTYWYNSGAWVEWTHASLSDYEEFVAGPSDSSYDSTKGVGKYYGCTTNGNALLRGARWSNGVNAGVFTMAFNLSPSKSADNLGFRCVR